MQNSSTANVYFSFRVLFSSSIILQNCLQFLQTAQTRMPLKCSMGLKPKDRVVKSVRVCIYRYTTAFLKCLHVIVRFLLKSKTFIERKSSKEIESFFSRSRYGSDCFRSFKTAKILFNAAMRSSPNRFTAASILIS